jgi:rhamnose transport system substrate-binding protein
VGARLRRRVRDQHELAGKFDPSKVGATVTAGKAGTFTAGQDGEVVYGKPLVFTKESVGKYDF